MIREAHHKFDKRSFTFIGNGVLGHAGLTAGGLLINIGKLRDQKIGVFVFLLMGNMRRICAA